MCYKIHLYTKNWNRGTNSQFNTTQRLYNGRGAGGGRKDHSIEFVEAKPSIVKFLVLLGMVNDTISIDNNKQNLHLQHFIII